MPVVINEFEIVPAAEPPRQTSTAPTSPDTAPPPAAAAREIEHMLRRARERAARLRAH